MTPTFARTVLALAVVTLTAGACGDADDPYDLTAGEVVSDTTTYAGIDYDLSSESYKRWLTANTALDSAAIQPAVRLDPRRATEDDIDRVVNALSADARARAAIESADISVRDYVLTSVALAQSWDALDRPGSVTGVPVENVAFLRRESAVDARTDTRPSPRIIRRGGGHGGADSDSDSDRDSDKPKGKKRGKGKGEGKGRR